MISPRNLIALICVTVLSGCGACLPGQSKLDQGMVTNTAAAQSVKAADNITSR
jgi:uncharacterized protein YceK